VVIPKTAKVSRLRENIEVYELDLEEREYESITKLDKNIRFYDPLYQDDFGWNYTPYFF